MIPSEFVPLLVVPILLLALWIAWRIQRVAIIVLERAMAKMERKMGAVVKPMLYLATFLHESSHAVFLMIGGHGVKEFHVDAGQGHVQPKRLRRSLWGVTTFLLSAMAPFFLPPLLMVGLLTLVAGLEWPGLPPFVSLGALQFLFTDFTLQFLKDVARTLLAMDLSTTPGLFVAAMTFLLVPAAKPSYQKGSRILGRRAEGDLAVVSRHVRKYPWSLIVLLGLAAAWGAWFYVVPEVAWVFYMGLIWVSLATTLLALAGAALWELLGLARETKRSVAWIAPTLGVLVQVLPLVLDWGWSALAINLASLAIWFAFALMFRLLLPRFRLP